MSDNFEWTPGELLGMSVGYWQACALHTGVKLGIFTRIGNEDLAADKIAGRLNCDVRGVTMLLNALAALGLLTRKEGIYGNTEFSKSFLVKKSPHYVGHIVMHHSHMVETWAHLDEAVRTGKPVRKRTADEEEDRKSFLMGMFNMAMAIAPNLAKQIDLKGRRRLLDLGGGPGTYAIHFCLQNPDLTAAVYDLPTTEPYARETIERFGLLDRVDFMSGDFLEDGVEGMYDVAWLSHILHSTGPDGCQTIIEKAVAALEPGGLLLVHEFILDDTFDTPLFAAIFSLNMLVNTDSGQSYSEGQIIGMLKKAGLEDIHRLPFKGPNESGIICGKR